MPGARPQQPIADQAPMALKNSGSDFARSLRSDHATPSGALRKARPGPPPSLDDNSPVQHAGRDETGDQGRSSLHTPAAGPGKPPARPRPSSAV